MFDKTSGNPNHLNSLLDLSPVVSLDHKYLRYLFKAAVFTACMVYLVRCAAKLELSQLRLILLPAALGCGVLYFFCTLLMAQAWRLIVLSFHPSRLSFAQLAAVHLRSSLAKYIPSNVMHYAARHYMCRELGVSQKTVLVGNLFEIAVMLAAALALLAGFVVVEPALLPEAVGIHRLFLRITVLAAAVGLAGVLAAAAVRLKARQSETHRFSVKGLAAVFVLDVVFLPLTGVVLSVLLWAMRAGIAFDGRLVVQIVFAYICAWTLGFVTPGAPGGLGVREATLTAILGPAIGHDTALLGALLFRLCTVFGEVLGYGFAVYLERCRLRPLEHRLD